MVRVPLMVIWAPSEESPPYILTLWLYFERQIYYELILGLKRLRTTGLGYFDLEKLTIAAVTWTLLIGLKQDLK